LLLHVIISAVYLLLLDELIAVVDHVNYCSLGCYYISGRVCWLHSNCVFVLN